MEYAHATDSGIASSMLMMVTAVMNSDRPAFQELLMISGRKGGNSHYFKDQSRLGRNHIETGTYMEIFFPEHGVRYIAINDGYDSNEHPQMDIAPFRNIINEMYAKDTSLKRSEASSGYCKKSESISPAAHRLATRKTLPTTITKQRYHAGNHPGKE